MIKEIAQGKLKTSMNKPSAKTTFTLAEAAKLLSCHPETLRRAIRKGELQAAKLGRGFRISRSDLQAFWTANGGGELFGKESEDLLREWSKADSMKAAKKKPKPQVEQLSLPGTSDAERK